jgi:hypothetical protein
MGRTTMDNVAEAMLRAQIAQEINWQVPKEIVTDWEAGYAKGLKKAMEIVGGK